MKGNILDGRGFNYFSRLIKILFDFLLKYFNYKSLCMVEL